MSALERVHVLWGQSPKAKLQIKGASLGIGPIFGLLAGNGAVFGIGGFESGIWTYFRVC
jgi:hypothetical protein